MINLFLELNIKNNCKFLLSADYFSYSSGNKFIIMLNPIIFFGYLIIKESKIDRIVIKSVDRHKIFIYLHKFKNESSKF